MLSGLAPRKSQKGAAGRRPIVSGRDPLSSEGRPMVARRAISTALLLQSIISAVSGGAA
jgi:hypothetical protein